MRLSKIVSWAILVLLAATPVWAANVTLAWDPPSSGTANLTGYRLHYGNTSKGTATGPADFAYDTKVDVGNVTQYTINGLADVDQQWCFAATAYSDAPEVAESDYSNEVCIHLTKLGPPGNPKVVKIEFPR